MQAMDRHPSLRVSDVERQRATEVLQIAYSDGRLDEVELDQRLSAAMQAQTRRDLTECLRGLPAPSRATYATPVPAPNPNASVAGGLAHLSGLATWVVGPLVVHAASPQGSPARRQAAEAFNFQLIALPLYMVAVVLGSMLLPDGVVGAIAVIGWLAWLLLTIVGSARAFSGQPWRNPLTTVIRWRPLDPGGR